MLKLAKNGIVSTSALLKSARKFTVSCMNASKNNQFENQDPPIPKEIMTTITNSKYSYATSVAEVTLVSDRIHDLVEKQAELLPKHMVFGFPHQQTNLTFYELRERVKTMVASLSSLGLSKGDRVAFALPNNHEVLVSFLAAAELGLISVILNPAYQLVEMEYMLKKTNVKALFIYDTFKTLNQIGLMQKLCPELETSLPGELKSKTLPDLKHIIILNSPLVLEKKTYKGTWQFSELAKPKSQSSSLQLPYVDIEDPCLILFTSGTTGLDYFLLLINI
jgi:acyl-CoA synthetase (AMP-forming)/AMP-acid ligase II